MASDLSLRYLGQLRCIVTRESTKQSVTTDAGVAHGGRDEYLSPVEMTVASLASCAASMLAVVAERNGLDVSDMRVSTHCEMIDRPARRIGSVRLVFDLPDAIPEAMRSRLEAAVKACPVKNSLHPDIRLEIEMNYGGSAGS